MVDVVESGEVSGEDEYQPLAEEKISEIAKGIVANEVFISWQISERDQHMLGMIFMPLMFMDELTTKQMQNNKITHLWAKMNTAGPRGINGYPIFSGMGMLNQDDARRIHEKVVKIEKLLADI